MYELNAVVRQQIIRLKTESRGIRRGARRIDLDIQRERREHDE